MDYEVCIITRIEHTLVITADDEASACEQATNLLVEAWGDAELDDILDGGYSYDVFDVVELAD